MDSFERKVLDTIRNHSLLEGGEKVVVAISGGPDSVALLLSLVSLTAELDLTVHAAHVNHQLRGKESDEDELFVTALCKRLKIPLESRRIRTNHSNLRQNLEDVARQQRYDFLARMADRDNAVLATGHNRNDQAETFLMKLLRGAGPSGLSGIFIKRSHRLASTSVCVIRPLLEVTREEIVHYLDRRKQPFRKDSTNTSLDYDRNWVRHQLLPTLEGRFGESICGILARNASLFAEIEVYLNDLAEKMMIQLGEESEGDLLIDLKKFLACPMVLRKQIARTAIRRVKGDLLDLTQQHVLTLLELSEGTSGKQIHLPAGVRVTREFDRLRIGLAREEVPPFRYELPLPGRLHVPEVEKSVLARKISAGEETNRNLLSKGFSQVTVRNRRPGDRYLTSLHSVEKNVKKLFLEKRVPISTRDRLIMLESEGKVIWIEGFPVDPAARPGSKDLEGIEIEVIDETFGAKKPSK